MCFGNPALQKEYRVTVILSRNGKPSGSSSSKYFHRNMSDAINELERTFKFFQGEQATKITITKE